LSIFIEPPSIEELERRLISRNTDDAETIKTRVAKAEEEMSYAKNLTKSSSIPILMKQKRNRKFNKKFYWN
jgi:guanylate kinase